MERRRKGREEGEKGETAENRQGKIRGLRREEVTPGETHLPHQLWSVCLSVLGDGWTASRKKRLQSHKNSLLKDPLGFVRNLIVDTPNPAFGLVQFIDINNSF